MTLNLYRSVINNGGLVRTRSQIGSFILANAPPVGSSRRRLASPPNTGSRTSAGPPMQRMPQRRRVLQFRAADSKHFNNWFNTKEESSTDHSNVQQHPTMTEDSAATTPTFGRQATLYEIPDDSTPKWNISQQPIIREHPESFLGKGNPDTPSLSSNVFRQGFFWDHIVKHFLPAQYPHSVANGYARFTVLAFSASVAGSAAMVLSTQTLLLAVGVVGQTSGITSGSASIMAGALNWVLKDGIGQLGGVIFASKMGEMKKFDSDPKRWRMLAALSLDGASFLEILSPLVWSSWVLPVACIANIGKNVGFLTASASRAAIHQSLAIKGNLADVTAKSASQSMAAGLLGTGVGIGLSTFLDYDATNFIAGFCALSMIHQGCNYQSLKSVPLQHFNRHRLHILLSKYMETGVVLEPSQVAKLERYFPLLAHDDNSHEWLSIGSCLHDLCPGSSSVQDFEELCGLFGNEMYLLNLEESSNRIHLVFQGGATGEDLIQGMYHAYLLRNEKKDLDIISSSRFQTLESTYEKAATEASLFLRQLESNGWKTGTDVTNVEPQAAFRLSIHDPS